MPRHILPAARPLSGAFLLVLSAWIPGFDSIADDTGVSMVVPGVAVATAHPDATRAGVEVLARGGNAFDAAIAISAALAVVEPYSSGIGGGGFWLLHRARDNHTIMLDGRERAPLRARRDMYLDSEGAVIDGLSVDGPLAAGIPGVAAALDHLAEHYGSLPLADTLAPAIRLARGGFLVEPYYRRMAGFRLEALRRSAAAARIFLLDNDVPPVGHRVVQDDLAAVLEQIARHGAAGFYEGRVARDLVDGVVAAGGIWTRFDLSGYQVVERRPIEFRYRGARLVSASPPSSGGVAIATMLNILSAYDLDSMSRVERIHLAVEAMRRAYRDRAEYLGDPDFVDMPIDLLTDPRYAAGLRAAIRRDRATASAVLPGAVEAVEGGRDTTHFSVIDAAGNRVAATLSINYPFGSGFVVPGTGVLLNDEMDDFSARPGTPNVYGLVGGEANAIEPSKRMLSSMSPTFVEHGDRLAVLGTPGGSRIITMVMLGALRFIEGGDAASIVTAPRFHHQFLPDRVQVEPDAFDEAELLELQWLGHEIERRSRPWGNMQAIVWDRARGTLEAASDPRGIGLATVVPAPSKAAESEKKSIR